MKMVECPPALFIVPHVRVEHFMGITSQERQVDSGGFRRILAVQGDQPIAQSRRSRQVSSSRHGNEAVLDCRPIRFVGGTRVAA